MHPIYKVLIIASAIIESGKSRNLRFLAGFGTESQRIFPLRDESPSVLKKKGHERRNKLFEAVLYEETMIIARIHEALMHLNDSFELSFDDKALHFIVMAAMGMMLFFAVHFVFKRLAQWSITAISFIYVFTVMTVIGFAIEIGQKITGTGEMEFRDVVAGLYGVLAFFAVYTAYRLIAKVAKDRMRRKKKAGV